MSAAHTATTAVPSTVAFVNVQRSRNKNKHAIGHEAVVISEADVLAVQGAEAALQRPKTGAGNPLWRGMHRVKGRAGSAAASGKPEEQRLERAVFSYTAEVKPSTYTYINKKLKQHRGAIGIGKGTMLYKYVVDLTMAVRLLWSPTGPSVVYRGVDAPNVDVAKYQDAFDKRGFVMWYSFSSTSTDRAVAVQFATKSGANGGVLFIIKRQPTHVAAADVSRCSAFADEHEVLLLPEQKMRVLQIRPGGASALTEVELEEVPRFPADGDL